MAPSPDRSRPAPISRRAVLGGLDTLPCFLIAADPRRDPALAAVVAAHLDIDPIAAGGGGVHCTTQQQPRI